MPQSICYEDNDPALSEVIIAHHIFSTVFQFRELDPETRNNFIIG